MGAPSRGWREERATAAQTNSAGTPAAAGRFAVRSGDCRRCGLRRGRRRVCASRRPPTSAARLALRRPRSALAPAEETVRQQTQVQQSHCLEEPGRREVGTAPPFARVGPASPLLREKARRATQAVGERLLGKGEAGEERREAKQRNNVECVEMIIAPVAAGNSAVLGCLGAAAACARGRCSAPQTRDAGGEGVGAATGKGGGRRCCVPSFVTDKPGQWPLLEHERLGAAGVPRVPGGVPLSRPQSGCALQLPRRRLRSNGVGGIGHWRRTTIRQSPTMATMTYMCFLDLGPPVSADIPKQCL